jgi:hypothetical protein
MKKWEAKQIIRERYGDTIRGRHIDNMSEAQLITVARAILERENDEVYNISAYISKGFVKCSNERKYYYNDKGQLCITNDAGEEEIVDEDSLDDEE